MISKTDVLEIPIAHAEGRYYVSKSTLDSMEQSQQIIFKYCDEKGTESAESNPNGSIANIAGICNKEGNVFAMMPHPERASEDVLGNVDGKIILQSLVKDRLQLVV